MPGLRQALTDLQAATSAAAAAAADAAAAIAAFRPAAFTRGFSYTPDAVYPVPSPGLSFGAGFSSHAGSTVAVHRWGSALALSAVSIIRFDPPSGDLNDYAFYNEPFVIVPSAWLPGNIGHVADRPPFMTCSGVISHNSSTVTKQTNVVQFSLTEGYGLTGAVGFTLENETLNSALFAPGDHLTFLVDPGAFLLCPDGADFT